MSRSVFVGFFDFEQRLDEIGVSHCAQRAKPRERLPTFTGEIETSAVKLATSRKAWAFTPRINQCCAGKFAGIEVLTANFQTDRSKSLRCNFFDGTISGLFDFGPY